VKKILITGNILLLILSGFLFVRGKFWDKSIKYIYETLGKKNTFSYEMNRHYKVKADQHRSYNTHADIVMFGDSMMELADWNEILGISPVANRGISGDITEGMLKRIDTVLNLKPKICFFSGSMNDNTHRVSFSKTLSNIRQIAGRLKENGVTVIFHSVLYTGDLFFDHERANIFVPMINAEIKKLCDGKDIIYLDMNELLCPGGILKREYTYDGLHLNPDGYKIWGGEVNKILAALQINGNQIMPEVKNE
jgi:lysophospholipase L1-like esterase